MPYIQYNTNTSDAPGYSLEKGDVLHFGFEFATDSLNGAKDMRFDVQNAENTRKSVQMMTTINGNGQVRILGTPTDFNLPVNKWVRFDFVVYTEDNTLDVYINGVNKVSKVSIADKVGSSPKKLNFVRLFMTMSAKTVDGKKFFPLTNNYIDNFYVGVSKTAPEIKPTTLAHTNAAITIDNSAHTVQVPGTVTASELLSGFTANDASSISVVNATGEAMADTLTNGYVRVNHTNGTYSYYELTVFQLQSYLDEDFIGKTITDAATLKSETGLEFGSNIAGSGTTTLSTAGGLGGRAASDESLVLNIDGFQGGENNGGKTDLNLIYYTPEDVSEDIVTIEIPVLLKTASAPLSIQVPMNNNASYMKTMASFETSGAIKVNGADTGMKWEPNRWYKVASND